MRVALAVFALIFLPGTACAQDLPFASFDKASKPVLNDPHDLAIGPDGMLYVADKFGHRIAILDPETLEVTGSFGDGVLPNVHDISFGDDGRAHLAVTGSSALAVFGLEDGEWVFETMITGFPRTEGVLAHSSGRTFVMASGTGQLTGGDLDTWTVIASGFLGAHDLAEAPDGTIWVADNAARRLVQLTMDGEVVRVLDGPQYGFLGPRYLDVDDFGRLIVADQDAHRVLLIDPEADQLLGVLGDGRPGLGPGKFDDPEGVAVHGNAYFISDSDNNRVVKYVVVLN